jgi:hypothetical protein
MAARTEIKEEEGAKDFFASEISRCHPISFLTVL